MNLRTFARGKCLSFPGFLSTDRDRIFTVSPKIDRSELVCLIESRRKVVAGYVRWKRRACHGQRGSCTVKNVGDYRDTTKRGQPARVGTFPGDNDPLVLFFRPCVWSSSGFRSPFRSAFLYLTSSFPAFFQPPADDARSGMSLALTVFRIFRPSQDSLREPSRFNTLTACLFFTQIIAREWEVHALYDATIDLIQSNICNMRIIIYLTALWVISKFDKIISITLLYTDISYYIVHKNHCFITKLY